MAEGVARLDVVVAEAVEAVEAVETAEEQEQLTNANADATLSKSCSMTPSPPTTLTPTQFYYNNSQYQRHQHGQCAFTTATFAITATFATPAASSTRPLPNSLLDKQFNVTAPAAN